MISDKDRSQVASDIRHAMLEFQVGDLEKAMANGLNFLVAIGLMVSTEFLGGLVTGSLGLTGPALSRQRFEAGFNFLGEPYKKLLQRHKKKVFDIYQNVRCGFVHQYLPSNVMGVLGGETFGEGIGETQWGLLIFVSDYLRDLKAAVNRLLGELQRNDGLFLNCQKALAQIPKLL